MDEICNLLQNNVEGGMDRVIHENKTGQCLMIIQAAWSVHWGLSNYCLLLSLFEILQNKNLKNR